jgi:hypothetical protein
MSRELVFVHGRSQQHKDPGELKTAWIDAWQTGLDKSGLTMPIESSAIRFPYYGDTLDGLLRDADDVADVVVRGSKANPQEAAFFQAVFAEACEAAGVTDDDVREAAGVQVIEQGPLNWRWVRAIVTALDKHLPGGSGATIALVTADVWRYLRNPGTQTAIESGVRKALPPQADSVVVAHSLGTVVAYNLLERDGDIAGWKVPLLVTVGSPLGVTAIRDALRPIGHPDCVGTWFNAMDPDDIVALYPLEAPRWDIEPAIENKVDVDNDTPNQHGIAGYLSDAVVAKRIYDAVVAA